MSEQTVFGTIEEPTAQDVSNFLCRAAQYIRDRRPYELVTIAILNEKCFDVMDAFVGSERVKGIQ